AGKNGRDRCQAEREILHRGDQSRCAIAHEQVTRSSRVSAVCEDALRGRLAHG
ncbi:unnamed protein product, partial [Symbiodinium sp. KB8]